MTSDTHTLMIAFMLAVSGCASSGTKAHDMSVEQHERAGDAEEAQAEAHAEQYDPLQEESEEICSGGVICWSTWGNPTAEHQREATRHRQLAKKHRAAAETLRGAERDACAEVDERDRDLSPFFHSADISSVTVPTLESEAPVVVAFRAVPGLSRAGLQQLVDCHLARSAATGHEMPGMDYCPLVPRDVAAAVTEEEDGSLLVTITVAKGAESRAEVLARADRLKLASSTP